MRAKLTVVAGCLVFCAFLSGQRPSYIQPPVWVTSPPQLIYSTRPVYPKLAKAARIEGPVSLRITIGTSGTVDQVKLISGHPFLVEAAIAAVKQWRYRPRMVQGMPVVASVTVDLNFSLREDRGEPPTFV